MRVRKGGDVENRVLTIALQDGFSDDAVTVRVDDRTVIDNQSMRTDQRIGLAYALDVPAVDGLVTVQVHLPGRDLQVTRDIDTRTSPFVGISLLDGELVVTTSQTPFGYA
jgi:hypothetical protein